jgi:hypothetical protein
MRGQLAHNHHDLVEFAMAQLSSAGTDQKNLQCRLFPNIFLLFGVQGF